MSEIRNKMMSRIALLQQILQVKVVAIIRTQQADVYQPVAEALYKAGVTAVEVSLTSVNALKAIEELVKTVGRDMQIGVGSVLDSESARRAIEVGSQYMVTPVTRQEVIQMAHRYDLPVFSGAFSPGEILQAYEWGADVVKVFPAEVLGMAYFKAIKAPMPQLQLMPTGGVTLQNGRDWIKAGACALGVGSALFDEEIFKAKNYQQITENALVLVNNLG